MTLCPSPGKPHSWQQLARRTQVVKKKAQVNTTSAGAGWKLPEFDLVVKRSKTSGKGLQVTVITAK